jgi:hypothetical protein
MLIQQIAGPFTQVPAWLNEGSARLEDLTVAGSGWKTNLQQFGALSAAVQTPNLLIPLADLVSQDSWNRRTETLEIFQYSEAAEAVRELRQDVGIAGTVQILALMSSGQSFESAFQSVAHRPTVDFYTAFPARLKASGATPGVATSTDTSVGAGVSFMAYGFAPSAALTLTIAGSGYQTTSYARNADGYGTFWSYLDSSWAAGTYTFTFTDSTGRSASATVAKASSFESGALTLFDALEMPLVLPEPVTLAD